MNKQYIADNWRSWINPPHPGRGKSRALGFLLGFMLGVFGVGLYLRSFLDFGLSLAACIILIPFLGGHAEIWLPVFCGLWVVGRIYLDTPSARPPAAQCAAGAPPSGSSVSPSPAG
ncbi:MAG: hypothetical protein IT431_15445 [Phycisphaerales bacterium]|nr:hypothetical protein [Phycisphaerales bacterium]